MSNIVTRLKNKIKNRTDPLYNSPIGSIISTIAILTEHSVGEARALFTKMRLLGDRLPCHTTLEICDYVYEKFGHKDDKPFSDLIVLVYDKLGTRSPLVSFMKDGMIMPIDPQGFVCVNILSLANEGRDWVGVEYVYGEDEENDGHP